MTIDERFWSKVDRSHGHGPYGHCWAWTASKSASGYGQFNAQGTRLAHRRAYEMLVGPIPDGLQLDHLCRVRHCVNPAHLEPVTPGENVRRGVSNPTPGVQARVRAMRVRTHCKRGHEMTGDNLRELPGGHRRCRSCDRDAAFRWKAKNHDVLTASGRSGASDGRAA